MSKFELQSLNKIELRRRAVAILNNSQFKHTPSRDFFVYFLALGSVELAVCFSLLVPSMGNNLVLAWWPIDNDSGKGKKLLFRDKLNSTFFLFDT